MTRWIRYAFTLAVALGSLCAAQPAHADCWTADDAELVSTDYEFSIGVEGHLLEFPIVYGGRKAELTVEAAASSSGTSYSYISYGVTVSRWWTKNCNCAPPLTVSLVLVATASSACISDSDEGGGYGEAAGGGGDAVANASVGIASYPANPLRHTHAVGPNDDEGEEILYDSGAVEATLSGLALASAVSSAGVQSHAGATVSFFGNE